MLKIAPFKKGFDEEVFVRIHNAAFSDYDDIRSMTLEEMKKLEKYPYFDDSGMFIAEWNGQPIGIVDAYVDKMREEKKGFIQSLGVLPEFRRKRIATKLVEKAIQSLRQRDMKLIETWAQTDKIGCIRLFESFGFIQIRSTSMMQRRLCDLPSDVEENREITLKKMRLTDEEEFILLNRLDNESFREHFNYRPRTVEETRYMLRESPWWQNPQVYFAVLAEQPVGYIIAGIDSRLNREKDAKYGWILDIGVLKPHRRKKIGATLMLHAMRLLKQKGMKDALLYVDDTNPTGAFKLYKRLGFKVARKNIVYQLKLA